MAEQFTIQQPTFKIYKDKVLSNLRHMILKSKAHGAELHPHYKTHQSEEVGFWAKGEGIRSISVSSLSMAEKFRDQDYKEITVAFPLNRRQIDDINRLAKDINLVLTVVSESGVRFLKEHLQAPVKVALEIDPGYGRSGIEPDDFKTIDSILEIAEASSLLQADSFMAHTGQNYHAKNTAEILNNHAHTVKILAQLKSRYKLKTSLGDTPSCTVAEDFGDIDIWRPGNFVYYDLMQQQMQVCQSEDIAVSMLCPVTARNHKRKEIVIHGGAVHFSKEKLQMPCGKEIYGLPVIRNGEKDEIPEGSYLKSLSQEHGILQCSDDFFRQIDEGDLLEILPVHSCLTANLMSNRSVVV